MRTYSARHIPEGLLGQTLSPPWLLAYNGGPNGATYQIGIASSQDAITWTRSAANPVIGPGLISSWEGGGVKDPYLLRPALGDYRIWYGGYDSSSVHQGIGLATSPVGDSRWTKSPRNPVLAIGSAGAWDDTGIELPAVLYEPSDTARPWKMWYLGWTGSVLKIGYAYSSDGIAWTKSSANPVLAPGAPGSYDAVAVIPEWVMKIGSTYYLFYSGRPTSGSGISGDTACLVTFTNPEGVYTKSANNPLLSPSTAIQSLTSDLTSGTAVVHIGSTTGFHVGEPVLLFDSGVNQADAKILSIDSGSQLTLTANVSRNWTVANSASIRSAYYASLDVDSVLPDGKGGWVMYGTSFQQFSSITLSERAIAATSPSALDSGWAFDYARGLMLPLGLSWDTHSAENPRVIANTYSA